MSRKKIPTKHVTCPLCGADKAQKLFDVTRNARVFTIVRCKKCDFTYQNPRPRNLADLYSEEYFEGGGFDDTVNYTGQNKNRKDPYRILHRERLKNIEKLTPGRRILDVGCAYGKFLLSAKKRGWKTYGVEISQHAADSARKENGLNVKTGTLIGAQYPSNYFDCITMFDVIEHVDNPREVAAEVQRILRPGGVVVIETGDVSSITAELRGNKWGYFIHGHIIYFSRKTLRRLLKGAGLKKVKEYRGDEYSFPGHFSFCMERAGSPLKKLKYALWGPFFHFVRKVHVLGRSVGGMLFIYKK